MTSIAPKVSVVIPNYNGIRYLRNCLESVYRESVIPDRVIVVDNGSKDGSAEEAERLFPQAEMLRMGENTGFCGAVNAGIRASAGMDYIILLNNDTVVDRNFTRELVRAMERKSSVFSCQAKMLSMKNPHLMDDAGDLYCGLGWAFARGKGKPEKLYRRPAEIFSCCAGAAIYRKSILDEIGLFDENHFAYLEDCDIGWRARIHGYHNLFIPSARVLHVGSASSGSVYNLFKVINTSRNSIYVIAKNMPVPQILLNLPTLILGFLVKAAFFAAKGYGREYVQGIAKGFLLAMKGRREGKIVRFYPENTGNYVRIQIELWINIVRRFLQG